MKYVKVLLIAIVSFMAVPSFADCYSEGFRTGTIQKLSRKGLMIKSWEGELVMSGLKLGNNTDRVASGNIWAFSVTDSKVAKQLEDALMNNSEVTLKYCESYIHVSTDTGYEIVMVATRK